MTGSSSDIRAAILEALPEGTSLRSNAPDPRHIYTPFSHTRALRLDRDMVIGGRGVGKSFWCAALREGSARSVVANEVSGLSGIDVHSGHDETPSPDSYPDPDLFSFLMEKGYDAYWVWCAVVARWLTAVIQPGDQAVEKWDQTVERVKSDPETFARLLQQVDQSFSQKGRHGLIVFDALDRLSADWARMDQIVRDLLRVVLRLRQYGNLHAKVFLREDQFNGRVVANFPDASKILADRVELTWAPHDLHGLLWQYLINAPSVHGNILRRVFDSVKPLSLAAPIHNVWRLPHGARREDDTQKRLFAVLAGEYMGRDARRGNTYTWSVGHLADAWGRTSPRSFLAAIRAAAEDSADRYYSHGYPLHYESIKRGVQTASQIRVNEMAEDYPWVRKLMVPLQGRVVPCLVQDVENAWASELADPAHLGGTGLPPEHAKDGWAGVMVDLIALGIFQPMKDSRLNMPDLYRVGFGLGRRGGVKPVPKSA